jgi:tRNA-dihydrouridine synthase B
VVDINMGCPARKITTGLAGSALLRDLARVERIFRAMRAAVSGPLTVKMRWDWDEDRGAALAAARLAEGEGLDGICLHARTREQGYSGQADWDLIGRVREAAGSLPVIGNGDIRQPADALAMMRASGCEAVMIGRGVIGDPWLLAECLEAVRRREAPQRRTGPAWADRRALMLLHARMMVERLGPHGLIPFRKHAAAYLRGVQGVKAMRERLVRVTTMEELEEALPVETGEVCGGSNCVA